MKVFKNLGWKWIVPIVLIVGISLLRFRPTWAEGYSTVIYPFISSCLSAFSSLFPFSVGDCFIVLACLGIFIYPFYAWRKRKSLKYILSKILLFLMWVYIWFYLSWGINYFRLDFYGRTGITKVEYSFQDFQQFLTDYILELNENYVMAGGSVANWYVEPYNKAVFFKDSQIHEELVKEYRNIAQRFRLVYPKENMLSKWMLWSGGMSKVGVTGYMGPFLAEYNLNRDLLNVEYPFTYAHELAHRLGIASEAEANLYAYLVTTSSICPEICFSGSFSMLGYVMGNARRLLSSTEYQDVLHQIHPEILEMYTQHLIYWRGKYNAQAGQVQHKIYNAYLKGNQVSSGTKNYSEVVGLMIALRQVL